MAPDTPGDGLLKAIGCLLQRLKDIVTLGNGFRYIRERHHKPAVLHIRRKDRGINEVLHGRLLQVGEFQAELVQHGVQRSSRPPATRAQIAPP